MKEDKEKKDLEKENKELRVKLKESEDKIKTLEKAGHRSLGFFRLRFAK